MNDPKGSRVLLVDHCDRTLTEVYDYQKDKNKGMIGQTKQILIGTAAHIFKNRQTQRVATQVAIAGSLKKADVSTWEAFVVEIVEMPSSERYSQVSIATFIAPRGKRRPPASLLKTISSAQKLRRK